MARLRSTSALTILLALGSLPAFATEAEPHEPTSSASEQALAAAIASTGSQQSARMLAQASKATTTRATSTRSARGKTAKSTKSTRTSTGAARYGKQPKSKQPQQAPSAQARQSTAGAGHEPPEPVLSAELEQLAEIERELFGSSPWDERDGGETNQLVPFPGGAAVSVSGLAPSKRAFDREPPAGSAGAKELKLDYLSKLQMPDLPVKWTPRVLRYMEFYKNDPRGRSIATILYRKSGAYEGMLKQVLRHHGLPQDLMWVSVVESGLRPTVYSPAGAAGLWQFMPETGRLYGLVIDRWVDERLDPVRSTHAAAMFLADLYKRFQSWELALGSYNMGWGGMMVSIRKYNTNDFWDLCAYEAGIPWETTLYVPKILALAVVMKNPSVFGLSSVQRDAAVQFDEVDVVPGVALEAVATAAKVDISDIEQLNPQFLATRVPPQAPKAPSAGMWKLRVPVGRGALVHDNLVQTHMTYPKLEARVVRQGESLANIADSVGVSATELAKMNAMRPDEVLRPGTVVMVPLAKASLGEGQKPVVVVPVNLQAPPGQVRVFYQTVAGDTLRGVATALGVSADDLKRWNGLDPSARLQGGMSLGVLVPAERRFEQVRVLREDEVNVLVVGSDEFFAHFEGLRGRVRRVMVVGKGQTWKTISQQTGLSVGMLERINRKGRTDPLQEGEQLVIYVPKDSTHAKVLRDPQDQTDADDSLPELGL